MSMYHSNRGQFAGKVITGQRVAVTTKTANYTVTSGESGTIFNNRGATGAVTFTLPAQVAGLCYIFGDVATQNLIVAADTANTMVAFNDVAADSVALQTANQLVGGGFYVYCDGSNWIVHEMVDKGQTVTVV